MALKCASDRCLASKKERGLDEGKTDEVYSTDVLWHKVEMNVYLSTSFFDVFRLRRSSSENTPGGSVAHPKKPALNLRTPEQITRFGGKPSCPKPKLRGACAGQATHTGHSPSPLSCMQLKAPKRTSNLIKPPKSSHRPKNSEGFFISHLGPKGAETFKRCKSTSGDQGPCT